MTDVGEIASSLLKLNLWLSSQGELSLPSQPYYSNSVLKNWAFNS